MRQSTNRLCWLQLLLALLLAAGCADAGDPNRPTCQDDGECATGQLCMGSTCTELKSCSVQADCPVGKCIEGSCWTEPCAGDQQCSQGSCVQGFCVRKAPPNDVVGGSDLSTEDTSAPEDLGLEDSSTPEDTNSTDSKEPLSCVDNSGSFIPGICVDQTFCSVDWECVSSLDAGLRCDNVLISGEDENRVCKSDLCLPEAFGTRKFCTGPGKCAKQGTPASPGDSSCSSDKKSVTTCNNDGSWSTPQQCVPISCGSGKGKQLRECGTGGCQGVGACIDCYPGVFDPGSSDCKSACESNADCQVGSECQDKLCTANTTKQAPCDPDNNNPENSQDKIEDVTISWNPTTQLWTVPAKCGWVCNTDFDADNGACIQQKTVSCDQSGTKPTEASWVDAQATITFTTVGGWTLPPACEWICNSSWCKEGEQCLQKKSLACDDSKQPPANGYWIKADVDVGCTDDKWDAPALCKAGCNLNFCTEGPACLSKKSVECTISGDLPANAKWQVINESIECISNSWEETPKCNWACDDGFCADAGECKTSLVVSCSTSGQLPNNAEWILKSETLTCSGGNWTPIPACAWRCKEGYQDNDNNGSCLAACSNSSCSQYQYCDDLDGSVSCGFTNCGYRGLHYGSQQYAEIATIDPDGVGPLPARKMYCLYSPPQSMNLTIEFALGLYTKSYSGWTFFPFLGGWTRLSGEFWLADTVNEKAFLSYYNANAGVFNLEINSNSISDNCCLVASTGSGCTGNKFCYLAWGTDSSTGRLRRVVPAKNNSASCSNSYKNGGTFIRMWTDPPVSVKTSIGLTDFSNTWKPELHNECTLNNNPAFFWRKELRLPKSCADAKSLGYVTDGTYRIDNGNGGYTTVNCTF